MVHPLLHITPPPPHPRPNGRRAMHLTLTVIEIPTSPAPRHLRSITHRIVIAAAPVITTPPPHDHDAADHTHHPLDRDHAPDLALALQVALPVDHAAPRLASIRAA